MSRPSPGSLTLTTLSRKGRGFTRGLQKPLQPAQCAMKTGISAFARIWLVAPPKIIWRTRLCV